MTDLKQQAITLIEKIPDERTDMLLKILKNIRDIMDDSQDEVYSRAEQDLAIMEDIENLTREGGDL